MTASERSPQNPGESQRDDAPVRYDDPFWTDDRRAMFWDVVRRIAVAALLAFLAVAWALIAVLWLLDLALSEEPEPSEPAWLAWLLPSFGLFALSVARLVEPRAPAVLRVLSVLYAIFGTVVILSTLEFV